MFYNVRNVISNITMFNNYFPDSYGMISETEMKIKDIMYKCILTGFKLGSVEAMMMRNGQQKQKISEEDPAQDELAKQARKFMKNL